MADPEHLKILEQGTGDWNAWRRENPNVRPDLRQADLYVEYLENLVRAIQDRCSSPLNFDSDQDNVDFNALEEELDRQAADAEKLLTPDEFGFPQKGADFSGVDFQGADLFESTLTRADLSGANLTNAELTGADLGQAILRGADLTGAQLYKADLMEADLRGAILSGATLRSADLSHALLAGAVLRGAELASADLSHATLGEAHLEHANLFSANLQGADLSGAHLENSNLSGANLSGANLNKAILPGADLTTASFVETDLTDADITGCRIFGISAWGVKVSPGTRQRELVITPQDQPAITADDIEVAQFLYLLLHNEKTQRVIDTITTKVVLILGRFSLAERKKVLNALREELHKPGRDYVPVVFDFEAPRNQTTINTSMLLAGLARFVIADVSDAKSVLQELQAIVPNSPKLAVQPLIVAGQEEPGMFDFFKAFPWFLSVYGYESLEQLVAHLDERVIGPAEAKVAQLRT